MNFDNYQSKLPFPHKRAFTTTFWYKGGKCVCTQLPGESLASGFDTKSCVKEVVVDDVTYQQACSAWSAEEERVVNLFKQDLFIELGITYHPLRKKLYAMAWERGHANGLTEVFNCAVNLVDLMEIPEGAVLVSKDSVVWGPRTVTIQADEKAAELQDLLCARKR